jgi:hypothetical protein
LAARTRSLHSSEILKGLGSANIAALPRFKGATWKFEETLAGESEVLTGPDYNRGKLRRILRIREGHSEVPLSLRRDESASGCEKNESRAGKMFGRVFAK